jgi:UDP-glucose 4-epimerase
MIAETVRDRVSPNAEIAFGEGNKGWVGDVPRFRYSTRKLTEAGWTPRLSSAQAMVRAVDEIASELGV